jgi:hypothetical protein
MQECRQGLDECEQMLNELERSMAAALDEQPEATDMQFICTHTSGSGKLTVGKRYSVIKHLMADCYAIVDNFGNPLLVTKKEGHISK